MARYAQVCNVTRGTVVAERCRVADSLFQRVLGLHLLPRLEERQGLLLPGATAIDTTFMRYAIDLVFLDRSARVTRVVSSMAPWRMVIRANGGHDCLELPAGAASASKTETGDQLTIEEAP